MCGRTAETDIANIRRAIMRLFPNVPDLLLMDHPRYNIPPSLPLAVVGETRDGRFAERLARGWRPAGVVALFLALGAGIANGLGHLILAVRADGYFPGSYTAPLCFLAGGTHALRLLRRPAPVVPAI
jgi:hypothetical protein